MTTNDELRQLIRSGGSVEDVRKLWAKAQSESREQQALAKSAVTEALETLLQANREVQQQTEFSKLNLRL
jgi:hypothetical protein